MRRRLPAIAALIAACLLTAAPARAQQASGSPVLTIHADKPVSKVSPTLYGLMTEEINYSYDGGLYAEMVRNRTFETTWEGVLHWFLIEGGNAQAKMSADKSSTPGPAQANSLKLDVTKADPANRAGILNEGYWGMALQPNTTYKGSLYAKAASDSMGPLSISLVDNRSGKALAATTIPAVDTSWKRYEYSLKTGAIPPSATNHLAITVGQPGTLWLDLVSLFPPTYHNRENGNRADLMEKLAAMRPAFLRFPGGNYLEGNHIRDRFDWKKTIGPLVDRPTHPSPWGYQSTDGMGLLEFLYWCEDLKMQPVLAVYGGYSLAQEHVNPGPDLEPYVQDALDEIDFVTGAADSKWGAVRAKYGHPEPFKLNYVEVGNEDNFDKSGSYEGRFAQFYKAIKERYPQLQVIATMPVKGMKPDVLDEHFYQRAQQSFADATHYDKMDRNGPKIFVGEWATREGSPTPNMGAALGDAAWMTGLERNSDIVIMHAYAPLLVNVNPGGLQWNTDLIGYDALRSYGSPAYYAQVMFANNVGDSVVESNLENGGPKLFYSVTKDTSKNRIYLKLVNASSESQPITLKCERAKPAAAGRVIRLAGNSTQDTNSLAEPAKIVPVESSLPRIADNMRLTLPRYSIQVLRLDLK